MRGDEDGSGEPGQVEEDDELDRLLVALANPHRRHIVSLVGLHPWAVNQLARRRGLSLPAIHKHLAILDQAGLVTRHKSGRTTYVTINRRPLTRVQDWVGQFHPSWGSDGATYANYAHHLGLDAPDVALDPSSSSIEHPPAASPGEPP